jgi:integrase
MNTTFTQIFLLRKSKSTDNLGLATVYIRITINGVRTEFSTNRQCDPGKWIPMAGKLNGKTEDVKIFNAYLDAIQHRIYDIHRELVASGQVISGNLIKEKYFGVVDKSRMLLEIVEHHNQQFSELVGKQFSHRTLQKFITTKSHLQEFLKWKYKTNDIDIKKLGFEFINDFEFYLKTEKNCRHNTVMQYVKKLKKIVRNCVANNWLEKDPFLSYKVTINETNRIYLQEDELKRIEEKNLVNERMSRVRDIFIFSCYTGLSYSDIEKLTPADISIGIDGEKWIFTTRTKTDTASRIPLLPVALSIIEKYSGDPKTGIKKRLLPISSNQRMNSYLKELASACTINKELTFHCARHTFATTVTLTNGVPIETVRKMLGHKNLRTTQHYAKILDKKVSQDMSHLRAKFALNKPIDVPDTGS